MNAFYALFDTALDPILISGLVVVLTLAVAFNFFLCLRMSKLVTQLAFARLPDSVPVGEALPNFHGRSVLDGRRISASEILAEEAAVLVFLSRGCDKCRQRLPELERMLPLMQEAKVSLWVIGTGQKRLLRKYFETTVLLPQVLQVQAKYQRLLNPKSAAPFYIFIDPQRVVQASSLIGDDDWLSFRSQIGDMGSDEDVEQ